MKSQQQTCEILRVIDGKTKQVDDQVIIEAAVTIQVSEVGNFTLLCTPSEVQELAVGFLFTEGVITDIDQIEAISDFNEKSTSIALKIQKNDAMLEQRNLIVTSSCGFCGAKNIQKLAENIAPLAITTHISLAEIFIRIAAMQKLQQLQQQTGAAHAAALFDEEGNVVACCEDIGRHNALDKAIGAALLANKLAAGKVLVLSSRVSFEMVAKAAKAGVEIIVAISAPSSLAIEMAKRWQMTICGFVRNNKINIYSVSERCT